MTCKICGRSSCTESFHQLDVKHIFERDENMSRTELVEKNQWIDMGEKEPRDGDTVIVIGRWWSEISGYGKSGDYIGIGEYAGNRAVYVDSSCTYSTEIRDITHWMELPEGPR